MLLCDENNFQDTLLVTAMLTAGDPQILWLVVLTDNSPNPNVFLSISLSKMKEVNYILNAPYVRRAKLNCSWAFYISSCSTIKEQLPLNSSHL